MAWLTDWKLKLIGAIGLILAFLGLRVHDRRQGAKAHAEKVAAQDRQEAKRVADAARAARTGAASDTRDVDQRLRESGGLRDDPADRP